MSVVTVATSLVQVLLFIGGLVVGISLRGRDGKAALLVALGFGVQLLGVALSIVEGVTVSAYISSAVEQGVTAIVTTITYGFGLILALLRLAGCALIFVGLLRLVRRRPAVAAGVTR